MSGEERWVLWVNSVAYLIPGILDHIPTMNDVRTMWEGFLGKPPLGFMDSDMRVSRATAFGVQP